jgi:hypothetical protein
MMCLFVIVAGMAKTGTVKQDSITGIMIREGKKDHTPTMADYVNVIKCN